MGFNPSEWRYVNLRLLHRYFAGVSPCKQDQWKGGTMRYEQLLAMIVSVSVTVTVFAYDVQWILYSMRSRLYSIYDVYIYIRRSRNNETYEYDRRHERMSKIRMHTWLDGNLLHVRFILFWKGVRSTKQDENHYFGQNSKWNMLYYP